MSPATQCARCKGAGWVWLMTDTGGERRGAETSCPDCCGPSPHAVLDWREAHHWSPQARPCTHCGSLTHLRDDAGRPAHKICAAATAQSAASRSGGAA
jgi:hypothetical protein